MFKHKRSVSKRKRTVKIALAVGGTAAAAVVAATSAQAIVGGTPTTIDKNSFLVALQFPDKGWCTGTLISPTKVVTTASCLYYSGHGSSDTSVIAGRTNVWDKDGNKNEVDGVWFNPGFKNSDAQSPDAPPGKVNVPNNDIAVLNLKHPMPSKYKPIKWVPSGFNYKPGITRGRIIGWGATEADKNETKGDLTEARIRVLPDAACKFPYKSDYNPKNMVCAGKLQGGVDACYLDASVPLLISDGKEERLAGLISWGGDKCAAMGQPSVYTKVSKFDHWLAGL